MTKSGDTNAFGNDQNDFWAVERTGPLERIAARRAQKPPRKPAADVPTRALPRTSGRPRPTGQRPTRQHGNTQQIPVVRFKEPATRPFDHVTGLGGRSPLAGSSRAGTRGLQIQMSPLLRRVAALVLLLSLGAPVAMAMRGGDSGRSALGSGIPAAVAAAATTIPAATDPATAVAIDPTLAPAVAQEVTAETPAVEPAPQAVVAAPVCVKTYTVVAGDGWALIADKHSVALADLLASNAATVQTFLLAGSTICVPANATTPTEPAPQVTTPPVTQPAAVYVAPFSLACAKSYKVVSGDSWSLIASKHNVTIKEVLAVNAATSRTVLLVGRSMCVPANSSTPTTSKATTKPTSAPAAPTQTDRKGRPITPTIYPADRTYTPNEVELIIREIWPDDLETEALRIAWRESHYNPRAQNYCCYGLFQIYFNVHKKWLAEMGVTSGEQLLDPYVAARAGLKLQQRNGWGPWKL